MLKIWIRPGRLSTFWILCVAARGQTVITGVDFTLNSNVTASTTYVASNSITVNNGFGGCCAAAITLGAANAITATAAIPAPSGGASFVFNAGSAIRFQTGFRFAAGSNSTLSARITPPGAPGTLTVTTSSLPGGTAGSVYPPTTLSATGGVTPYGAWTVASGSMPPGLSLSSGGTISGTSTAPSIYSITVQVADAVGNLATKTLNLQINAAPLTILTNSLPNGTVSALYPQQTLQATGGTGTRSWSIATGSLPSGLSLTSETVGGTPTATGISTASIRVTDSTGANVTKPYAITVVSGAASGTLMRELVRMDSQVVAVETIASIGVTITSAPASVATGDTRQFTAAVTGSSNQNVTWAAAYGCGSNHVCPLGLYTAPASVPSNGFDVVTATSVADPSKSAQQAVPIVMTTVSISPASPFVYAGNTLQFSATVTPNANTAVSWSLFPLGYPPVMGNISSTSGFYTSPAASAVSSTVYNGVIATSQANSSASGTAFIQIAPRPLPHIVSSSPVNGSGNSTAFSMGVTGGLAPVSTTYWYLNTALTSGTGTGCLLQVNGNGAYAWGNDNFTFTNTSPDCTNVTASWSPSGNSGTMSVTAALSSGWSSGTSLNIWATVVNTASETDPAGWELLGTWTVP